MNLPLRFLRLLLLLLPAVCVQPLSGQAQTLYFCEGVDSLGVPVNPSGQFTIGEQGGYFDFLVRMDEGQAVNSGYVEFKIYRYDSSSNQETYDNTIRLDTHPQWTYMWKQVAFYAAGMFRVYVVDDEGQEICRAELTVQKK